MTHTERARQPWWMRWLRLVGRLAIYLILLVGAVTMLVPFLWMLSSALKPEAQVFVLPPRLIPNPVVWENLRAAWHAIPMARYYLNSIAIAVAAAAGQLLTSVLAAYVFARLEFPAKNTLFLVFLATMMIPSQVTMIPLFLILRNLKWIDTFQGVIVPAWFHPFGIFLLRQFFLSLPRELEDAARIDGCSRLGILYRIILPLAKPVLSTLAVFIFMFEWNNFLWPLIVLNTPAKYTLPIGLAMLRAEIDTEWSILMAATLISTLPVILIFLVAQKQIVKSVTMTGLKM